MTPDDESWTTQKCLSLTTMLKYIAEDCDDPGTFLQLYYLSRERDLHEAMLLFASLPEDMRRVALKLLSTLSIEAAEPEVPTIEPDGTAARNTVIVPFAPCHSALTS